MTHYPENMPAYQRAKLEAVAPGPLRDVLVDLWGQAQEYDHRLAMGDGKTVAIERQRKREQIDREREQREAQFHRAVRGDMGKDVAELAAEVAQACGHATTQDTLFLEFEKALAQHRRGRRRMRDFDDIADNVGGAR